MSSVFQVESFFYPFLNYIYIILLKKLTENLCCLCYSDFVYANMLSIRYRVKSMQECWCAAFVSDWQPQVHMHKKFQVNRTKIKGGCQSETKAAHQHSCIDLTLVPIKFIINSDVHNGYLCSTFSSIVISCYSQNSRHYTLFRWKLKWLIIW